MPENLGAIFPSLKVLKVERSKLKAIIRADLNGMSKLIELKLPNNELKELTSDVFYDLFSLVDLDLSENNLSEINVKQFAKLLKLKYLNLDFNDLNEVDMNLFKNNEMLETISLKNNVIEKLPTFLFRNLQQLTSLELDSNRIIALPDNIFESNKVIKKLTISNNVLRFVGKTNIDKVRSLTFFDFKDNVCTDSLPYEYSASVLVTALEAECSPNEQMMRQWLEDEVSGIKRLKRESDKNFECAKLEIRSIMENFNSTRDLISKHISTSTKTEDKEMVVKKPEFLSELSKMEKKLLKEIEKMADNVKEKLLTNSAENQKDTEEKIKKELQPLAVQMRDTRTDIKDAKTSFEQLITEKVTSLPTQVSEQLITKCKGIEIKLNALQDNVKDKASTTDISDIKTQILELKKCDVIRHCFDFMEKVMPNIKDSEYKNFFTKLNEIKNDLLSTKSSIEISFEDTLFDDAAKAKEEVVSFKTKLKSECKNLETVVT